MIKAIFYKEAIKCRRLIFTLTLACIALVVYTFLNNAYELRITGAVGVFSSLSEQSSSIIASFARWAFVIIPICIASVQYVNEVINKRLKLTLHLPKSETQIISAMQLFGLSVSLVLFAVIITPIALGMLIYYPWELIAASIFSLLPYVLGGVASYFFAMWVIVEPIWSRKVSYLIVWVIILSMFTLSGAKLYSYMYALPSLVVLALGSWACSIYSASRFKQGAQN